MLSGFFVTKNGKNLLAKTHDGAHIQLTRAEIGNGDVPEGQLVTDVTQLHGKIKELPLRDVKIIANNTACIPIQFSNKGMLTSFELKEIGIYALDPDDGEILYLYGNTSATGDKPDEIKGESEAPLEYLFNLNLTFDNGKDVKVTVDNGIIYATVQELLDMADTKVDKVNRKGLSTEDYTTAEKNKLAGIEAGANKYVHPATHPVGMITGLGTAATKDVGKSAGNIPVIESSGKLPGVIIPADDGKQDKLTFDTTPKSGSTNPVTSAGIYTALAGKANTSHTQGHDTITFNPEANRAGDVFPFDRGYVDSSGACRTAFMPADGIVVEYTQDNGASWKPYSLTDTEKKNLFSMNKSYIKLGGPNAKAQAVGYGVRITVEPVDRYTNADTFYCWFSSASSSTKCSIERSTIGAKTTFTTIRSNVPVSGGTGPNTITFAPGTFGGSASQTSNEYAYRFTFITTAISTTFTSASMVTDLRLYGSKAWDIPNQMMFNGHLYSWDENQNATFPAQLNADGGTFSGELIPNGGLAHVGTDGYIAYPGGGQFNATLETETGMLKITLPMSWTKTMIKFKVIIYDFRNNRSVDYIIAGYTFNGATPSWMRTTAYCLSPWGGTLSNLPVSFGHDGTNCAITIGTPTTIWSYPHVAICDVVLGYSNTSYNQWKSGWNLSFVTEVLPTVNMTISNTNIAYNVNHADSATTLTGLTSTVAELNYVDGLTSNIQTQLNSKAASGHTHTPFNIAISGSKASDLDIITRQSIGSARSNKSYGLPPGAITVEYSRDGGTTWVDYGLTDTQITRLFDETRSNEVYLGKSNDKTHTTQYMLRVTIIPVDRYCTFDGVYHWINTSRNTVKFKLERSTIGAKTTFKTVLDNQIISGGYSGNNIHYFTKGAFGGATDQTSNFYAYRLTYWMTEVNNNYGASQIIDIRFLGADVWKAPGSGIKKNMVSYGVPYTCDPMANTTEFPGTVSATNFDGTASKVKNKLTIGSKAYDGSAAVTITAADMPGLGTAATKNTGIAAGNVPVLGSDGKLPVAILPDSLSGGGTSQTWHAKDILGSGTTEYPDSTAESGYSVIIDTTAKNLNGSAKKYKAPFGTYVAIFRVQASTVTGSADKVKLEMWGASDAIASRSVKLSDFSTTSDWEYFKIPFVTKSTTGREIYPKVTCLNATGSIKVDTIVIVPNAFALM